MFHRSPEQGCLPGIKVTYGWDAHNALLLGNQGGYISEPWIKPGTTSTGTATFVERKQLLDGAASTGGTAAAGGRKLLVASTGVNRSMYVAAPGEYVNKIEVKAGRCEPGSATFS